MFAWLRPWIRPCERPELARRRADRPGPPERILDRDRRLPPPAPRDLVKRPAARHLVDAPDLQVVLQVAADRRQIRHHLDPVLAEQRPRPQPRAACRSFGLFTAPALSTTPRRAATRLPSDELDPGAGEPLRPPLDAEPHHLRPGADGEVSPPWGRPEECADRVPPQPRPLVHLEIADPLVVAVVEVRARRNPRLLAGRREGVEDRIVRPLPLSPELPRPAMKPREAPPPPRPPSASAPRARRNPAAPAPTTTPRPQGSPPSSS